MAASLFNKDKIFAIFALNGSMGKTFFVAGHRSLAFGCWMLSARSVGGRKARPYKID
jgi:hypothetical protein